MRVYSCNAPNTESPDIRLACFYEVFLYINTFLRFSPDILFCCGNNRILKGQNSNIYVNHAAFSTGYELFDDRYPLRYPAIMFGIRPNKKSRAHVLSIPNLLVINNQHVYDGKKNK